MASRRGSNRWSKTGTIAHVHKGSWAEALEAAGLDPADRASRHQQVADDELLADLHRLRDEFGRAPTATDVVEEGTHGIATYQRRFGSWSGALDAAGFDPDRGPTDDELLAELRRLRDELEKRPSMNDMTDHGAYGCSTYQRRFGSWSAALREAFDDPETED